MIVLHLKGMGTIEVDGDYITSSEHEQKFVVFRRGSGDATDEVTGSFNLGLVDAWWIPVGKLPTNFRVPRDLPGGPGGRVPE